MGQSCDKIIRIDNKIKHNRSIKIIYDDYYYIECSSPDFKKVYDAKIGDYLYVHITGNYITKVYDYFPTFTVTGKVLQVMDDNRVYLQPTTRYPLWINKDKPEVGSTVYLTCKFINGWLVPC